MESRKKVTATCTSTCTVVLRRGRLAPMTSRHHNTSRPSQSTATVPGHAKERGEDVTWALLVRMSTWWISIRYHRLSSGQYSSAILPRRPSEMSSSCSSFPGPCSPRAPGGLPSGQPSPCLSSPLCIASTPFPSLPLPPALLLSSLSPSLSLALFRARNKAPTSVPPNMTLKSSEDARDLLFPTGSFPCLR